MNYPLIKKFLSGLVRTPIHGDARDFVLMSDLEAELAKGVEYFGYFEETYELYRTKDNANYSGLLIGYQPLESSKPVSREEIEKALSESAPEYQLEDLLKRILENGVK